jgi:hypothetical protein
MPSEPFPSGAKWAGNPTPLSRTSSRNRPSASGWSAMTISGDAIVDRVLAGKAC